MNVRWIVRAVALAATAFVATKIAAEAGWWTASGFVYLSLALMLQGWVMELMAETQRLSAQNSELSSGLLRQLAERALQESRAEFRP